jgi:hypothetical protein
MNESLLQHHYNKIKDHVQIDHKKIKDHNFLLYHVKSNNQLC